MMGMLHNENKMRVQTLCKQGLVCCGYSDQGKES